MRSLIKSLLIIFIINLIFLSDTIGQCTLRGKVTDKNGEVLIGAAVYPKTNMSSGSVSDINGDYSIKLNESNIQVIVISFIGYKTIEDTIKCTKGGIIINNYVLESKVASMKAVTITAKGLKNNDLQMETIKKQSSATIDYISAETIKKTGDANVAAAVARVTGVSTNSGGLITVRGIGDRYLKVTINGSRIPTLDPFTNNIKLDLFPSSLIDNIIITKTARPDLPGDWAGAYISVETKDYPDSLSILLETSFGYNAQTSFNNVLTSERSPTDWLGFDNGLRDHSHNDYVPFKDVYQPNSNQYPVFAALGLSNYFNSMGVTNIIEDANNQYFKLGLVQLGLLGAAQFNDVNAINDAMSQYESLAWKGKAFNIINADAVKFEKSFPYNWNLSKRKAPLNNSQSFSIGNQIKLFGKSFGYLVGFRYSHAIQSDTNSVKNVYENYAGGLYKYSEYQNVSKETNGWSGLIKLAYKLNKSNNLSFMFMPNVTGVNNVKDGAYVSNDANLFDGANREFQLYESRKQLIYQLKTEHYIPSKKIKIEFNSSYTNGKSVVPDFMVLDYDGLTKQPIFDNTHEPSRYYRYLTENVFDSRISAEIPIDNKPDLVRKIKIGGGYLYNYYKNEHHNYLLVTGEGGYNNTNSNHIFDIDTINNNGSQICSVAEYYLRFDQPSDDVFGSSNIISGFAMIDYSINPRLRFSGGFRIEKAKIYTDSKLFDSLGLAPNDPRRTYIPGQGLGSLIFNPGELNKVSFLPSVNLIYKLNSNESAPKDIRINYSQTVARPSIRELSDNAFFDYELNATVHGNDSLKMVQINNYDLRFESYFKSGDNISVSLFYKDLLHHIELTTFENYPFTIYSWENSVNRTSLEGIEIEGKKNIFKWLEFRGNVTLVNSKDNTTKLPMFGQAPYIINSMLTYVSKKIGVTASINYNLQGSRLVIIGDGLRCPNVYEQPRHLIDFKISKKIGKHLSASFKVLDILNSAIMRSYRIESNDPYFKGLLKDLTNKNKNEYILTYDKYRYGTNYIFSLSYKL